MKVPPRTLSGFGPRLAAVRRRCGLSQEELAEKVGVSRRVIAYYETESPQPPGALLADLAQALSVSTDELLGVKPVVATVSRKTARLLQRLQKVAELPPADQQAVLKLVDALYANHQRARSDRPKAPRAHS